jgi:hypothetical protein
MGMGRKRSNGTTRGFACAVVLVFALGLAAEAAATTGTVARHTRIEAERNVLHAHRVLRRLDRRLVDARTGLPRTDTTVVCSGRGHRLGLTWPRFVCTIAYHRVHVPVLYEAQRANGFELHRIRRHR